MARASILYLLTWAGEVTVSSEGMEPTNHSHWRERGREGRIRLSGTIQGLYSMLLEGSVGEVTLKWVATQRTHVLVDQWVGRWVNG